MKCQALKMFLFVCIQFLEVKHHGICNKGLIKVFNLHLMIGEKDFYSFDLDIAIISIALEIVIFSRIFLSMA